MSLEGLTKDFPPVRALDGVNLSLAPASVHALVGENGAGKSTLARVLAGLEQPTSGRLLFDGKPVRLGGPADAGALGVAMVHQELSLAEELTVAESIFLGREPTRWGLLDRRAMNDRARAVLESLLCDIDPRRGVAGLSVAQRQMVEIARAVLGAVRLLIMDEPTAVLTRREVRALFELLGRLKQAGVGVLYVSHHLDEVLEISDRVSVLRDGRLVTTLATAELGRSALAERRLASLMVGRPLADHFPPRSPPATETALEVRGLTAPPLMDVDFDVRRGEILGFAGLVGAGRTELAETIVGLRRKAFGMTLIDGRPVEIRNLESALVHGVAYLSEDRRGRGLVMGMDVAENVTLASLRRYCRPLLARHAQDGAARDYARRLAIRLGDVRDGIDTLSGGNQQKVAFAKWLELSPRVLILDEPTRGVDVGAKEEIYRLIQALAGRGRACVLISSEFNELLGMCHRIAVMRAGRIVRVVDGATASEQMLMQLAAGVKGAEPA